MGVTEKVHERNFWCARNGLSLVFFGVYTAVWIIKTEQLRHVHFIPY